jgi:hypothetical protein
MQVLKLLLTVFCVIVVTQNNTTETPTAMPTDAPTACVMTQLQWRDTLVPERLLLLSGITLCNMNAATLLKLETFQALDTNTLHWIVSAHQLCTAVLNRRWIENVNGTGQISSTTLQRVDAALMILLNSMVRSCGNLTHWSLNTETQGSMMWAGLQTLEAFNNAQMASLQACPVVSQPTGGFSFSEAAQLFLADSETEAVTKQKVQQLYTSKALLTVFLVLTAIAAFLLGVLALMLWNKRRHYMQGVPTYQMVASDYSQPPSYMPSKLESDDITQSVDVTNSGGGTTQQ